MLKKHKIVEYVWLVVIILLFVFSIQMVKSDSLANQINSFGILAPIIFVLLKMSTLVVAPLSGIPLYLIAGVLFGNLNGLALSLLGDLLGSAICFLLSRFYGHRVIKFFVGDRLFNKITSTVAILKDTKSFLKARIAFFAIPELLSYASGLSKINFFTFSLINILFYLPINLIYIFFGYYVITIIGEHTFLFYFFILAISITGFWFLYKDHKNLDTMGGM